MKAPGSRIGRLKQEALRAGAPGVAPFAPVSAEEAVAGAVENAADGAGIVDDAVRLSALNDGEALNGPAVDDSAFPRGSVAEPGKFVEIGEVDDVFAVEVGKAVTAAQIQRIVAVVKQAHGALFVGGVREGV